MRKLRFIPKGGALVEVTTRTQQGRLLLTPSQEFNQIAVGVLARALERAQVRFHGMVCLSNHIHFLLSVPDAQQLAQFMNYFNGNLARRVAELYNWPDKVWGRRYEAIIVSDEPEAHQVRLRYLLAHGAKEDLVSTPREWPGIHLAKNLVDGEPLRGYWINQSKMNAAKALAERRGEQINVMDFATFYEVDLAPLPSWSERPFEEYQQFVTELLHQIEEETFERRRRDRPSIMGPQDILRANPHHRPGTIKHSPAPAFHTATVKVFNVLREAYAWFVAAYRTAAEKLKRGNRGAFFPEGSFPPGLPFVPG